MATTPKQRRGARQYGIMAGITGGPADRTDFEFRSLLGPLSDMDLMRIRPIYLEGYELGRKQKPQDLLKGHEASIMVKDDV